MYGMAVDLLGNIRCERIFIMSTNLSQNSFLIYTVASVLSHLLSKNSRKQEENLLSFIREAFLVFFLDNASNIKNWQSNKKTILFFFKQESLKSHCYLNVAETNDINRLISVTY